MQAASPSEIKKLQAKCEHIPPFVFQAVNKLLALNLSGDLSSFNQKELVAKIIELNPEVQSGELFEKKWLDFEPFYRANGWNVEYIKGAYYETFTPYWEFKVKRRKSG
jgi:hypothetical protein